MEGSTRRGVQGFEIRVQCGVGKMCEVTTPPSLLVALHFKGCDIFPRQLSYPFGLATHSRMLCGCLLGSGGTVGSGGPHRWEPCRVGRPASIRHMQEGVR